MPIENEKKFVLNLPEPKATKIADKVYEIEQGYIHSDNRTTIRIRKKNDDRIFTFKQRIDNQIIEIEKKISVVDYKELAKEAVSWVKKTRYIVDGWEIDYFKTKKETYFIMAEIEMSPEMEEPEAIPKFISDNLVYTVAKNDTRFSSRKLSNVDYANKLIKQIIKNGLYIHK